MAESRMGVWCSRYLRLGSHHLNCLEKSMEILFLISVEIKLVRQELGLTWEETSEFLFSFINISIMSWCIRELPVLNLWHP
jgi:hypothetical protein